MASQSKMNTIKFNSRVKGWEWLSNMYPCKITHLGYEFDSSEAAYMASKCPSRAEEFIGLTGMEAKKLGRKVKLTPDWDKKKGYMMGHILRIKFAAGSPLADKLLATGDSVLIEHAPWDKYWGDGGDGTGQNIMGRLLMKIRRELKEER